MLLPQLCCPDMPAQALKASLERKVSERQADVVAKQEELEMVGGMHLRVYMLAIVILQDLARVCV